MPASCYSEMGMFLADRSTVCARATTWQTPAYSVPPTATSKIAPSSLASHPSPFTPLFAFTLSPPQISNRDHFGSKIMSGDEHMWHKTSRLVGGMRVLQEGSFVTSCVGFKDGCTVFGRS